MAQVRHCYERRLAVNPTLAGQVSLRFVIGADGRVTAVTVAKDGLGDAEVASCLVARAKMWVFPQPAGGGIVTVTYPFRFAPAP
jgi:TonB family protein